MLYCNSWWIFGDSNKIWGSHIYVACLSIAYNFTCRIASGISSEIRTTWTVKGLTEVRKSRCTKKNRHVLPHLMKQIQGHNELTSMFYTKAIHYCAIYTSAKFVIP